MAQSDKRSTSPSKRSRVDETVLPDLNTAWVTENFQLANRMTMAFRPYGSPPPFDLDEYKDSFESWEIQWNLFIQLSNIDICIETTAQAKYKAAILKTCLSRNTLTAVQSSRPTKRPWRHHSIPEGESQRRQEPPRMAPEVRISRPET